MSLMAGLAGCGGMVDGDSPEVEDNPEELSGPGSGDIIWSQVRDYKQAQLDKYLTDNAAEFTAFRETALGASGVPKLLFDKFPFIVPEIWGPASDSLAPLGFTKNPWAPEGSLPLGLAKAVDANGLEVVTLSCGGCHMGKVIGPDGSLKHIVGAPNTQFNQFRTAVERTVADARYDAAFANTPLAALATAVKTKVLQRRDLINGTLGAYTFSPHRFPNAPDLNTLDKPGYLDAIGVALVSLIIPDVLAGNTSVIPLVLPPLPAQVDIPSVWRQSARPSAQWDGAIGSPVYRNLAAELGVIGSPALINFPNAKTTADFIADLPPPAYPFNVDSKAATAGAALYGKYCLSCHQVSGAKRFSAADVGTDPNRTATVTPDNRTRLIAALRSACTDPAVCDITDDEILAQPDTVRGYMAGPLDGIWSRAPYLHNGSVPTLKHLLLPATRPATFARGSMRYDTAAVGWAWDATAMAEPNTHEFDTGEAGGSNVGHSSLKFNVLDWSQKPKELAQLLEFL